jgi:hypothetical protein
MPPRPAERYDVPEDAEGRVTYVEQPVVVEHPAAPRPAVDTAPAVVPPALTPPAATTPEAASTAVPAIPRADVAAGWVAVAALAAVLIIVFVIGMKLTS